MGSCDLHSFSSPWNCWCASRHGCHAFRHSCHSYSPWHNLNRQECVKIIKSNEDLKCTFKIALNVNPFTAEELHVKVKNGTYIIIEGKKTSEPERDLFCACSINEFKRSYKIPRNFDAKQAQVILYSDHVLKVTIPGMMPATEEQEIPIEENPNKYEDSNKVEIEELAEEEIETEKPSEPAEPEIQENYIEN